MLIQFLVGSRSMTEILYQSTSIFGIQLLTCTSLRCRCKKISLETQTNTANMALSPRPTAMAPTVLALCRTADRLQPCHRHQYGDSPLHLFELHRSSLVLSRTSQAFRYSLRTVSGILVRCLSLAYISFGALELPSISSTVS